MTITCIDPRERFESKFSKLPNGCWQWNGAKKPNGYGNFMLKNKVLHITAHRASWLIYRGEIPEGMYVCHRCDNPACVNPDHLFIGTPKDNQDDMHHKGRTVGPRLGGALHYGHKLKNSQVLEVRNLRESGKQLKEIAALFNVSLATVSYICSRKTRIDAESRVSEGRK